MRRQTTASSKLLFPRYSARIIWAAVRGHYPALLRSLTELLETFAESGEPLGVAARDFVHRHGLWHRVSNIFVFRTNGHLVVQRRQSTKDLCPGAWDLSVAEHLQPGEDHLAGAQRGLREELGLEGVSLEAITGVIPAKLKIPELGIKDYEFQQCFRAVTDAALVIDLNEVVECRLFTLDKLYEMMRESPTDFTPWFRARAHDVGLFD